ncbi:unnamed protein product [Vicia faba]|uniref:Uncharacterized protein n=1 Tax=Vicia faba TaxID=3906 RepID=A0AAV1A9M7_VICFA|nr:unnamed protein product [Vicia faba]
MEGIRETEEWTDEKHSMYIKSIEASFVNDLYDSKQGNSTTGQFKVLRGGCWQKMNFERENSQMSRGNSRNDLIANPWIQHYRSSNKQENVVAPSYPTTTQVVSLSHRKKMYESQVYDQNMISSDTEVSDQNFVDEEVKCERKSTSSAKRRKSFDC